jgi:4-hydroxybenzoate polyprenyltransferase
LSKLTAFLRLTRPANIVTSVADILAGIAISGFFTHGIFHNRTYADVVLLCLATVGLYGGGIVYNDIFDAELDKIERPERPIPSGIITLKEATIFGSLLLLGGIICASMVGFYPGILAVQITVFALTYDKWGKHHSWIGPINMGICRGLNLLLGISILGLSLEKAWFVFFVPLIYIASITMISRGEVHGGKKTTLQVAALLYSGVIAIILFLAYQMEHVLPALLFLLPFAWFIFKPLSRAMKEPIGKNIGKAVKAGVIALILMDAAWAAAFGAYYAAFFIALLLPLSVKLAKIFAVT